MQFLRQADSTSTKGFMARLSRKFLALPKKEKEKLKGASKVIKDFNQHGRDQAAEVKV